MNRPRQLVLVRHAQSMRNEAKKGNVYFDDDEARKHIRGIPDHKIGLTALGHEQARQSGLAIREKFGVFDYVYHSGYRRTVETTEGILEAYTSEERARIKVRQNPFIRERDPGYAYDMTTEEANKAFPWLSEYWETFGGFVARPPGGESKLDLVNRINVFLGMLYSERAGDNVMAVMHGGPIQSSRFLLEHWGYDQAEVWNNETHPEDCGTTSYVFDQQAGRLALQAYNEVFWSLPEPSSA